MSGHAPQEETARVVPRARDGGAVMEKLPLVYVRGFAGGERGIEQAVEDPFYGFNEGSVHVRVGSSGRPIGCRGSRTSR